VILAELRRRKETGELPPGARVPSRRAITRDHGVAMATATKVLTELRHAGLVRAVPGVGTVVVATGRAPEPGTPVAGAPRTARAPGSARSRRTSGSADRTSATTGRSATRTTSSCA
jgi:DNA-binding GntR family transcriptional regulator